MYIYIVSCVTVVYILTIETGGSVKIRDGGRKKLFSIEEGVSYVWTSRFGELPPT